MDDIINIMDWAQKWLNNMSQAVSNRNEHLIMVLFDENTESEIDWNEDVTPSMAREYDALVYEANNILK